MERSRWWRLVFGLKLKYRRSSISSKKGTFFQISSFLISAWLGIFRNRKKRISCFFAVDRFKTRLFASMFAPRRQHSLKFLRKARFRQEKSNCCLYFSRKFQKKATSPPPENRSISATPLEVLQFDVHFPRWPIFVSGRAHRIEV